MGQKCMEERLETLRLACGIVRLTGIEERLETLRQALGVARLLDTLQRENDPRAQKLLQVIESARRDYNIKSWWDDTNHIGYVTAFWRIESRYHELHDLYALMQNRMPQYGLPAGQKEIRQQFLET